MVLSQVADYIIFHIERWCLHYKQQNTPLYGRFISIFDISILHAGLHKMENNKDYKILLFSHQIDVYWAIILRCR